MSSHHIKPTYASSPSHRRKGSGYELLGKAFAVAVVMFLWGTIMAVVILAFENMGGR